MTPVVTDHLPAAAKPVCGTLSATAVGVPTVVVWVDTHPVSTTTVAAATAARAIRVIADFPRVAPRSVSRPGELGPQYVRSV